MRTVAGIAVGCGAVLGPANLKTVGTLWGTAFALVWPFVLGGAIAFILGVPMRAIEKAAQKLKRTRRAAALCLTLLAVAGVLAFVLLLLIPQVSATANNIGKLLPGFWAEAQKLLASLLEKYPVLQEWLADAAQMDWQKLLNTVVEWAKNGGMASVGNAANAATGILAGMMNFFISMVFAIYVLMQRKSWAARSGCCCMPGCPHSGRIGCWRWRSLRTKRFPAFVRPVPGSLHSGLHVRGGHAGLPACPM